MTFKHVKVPSEFFQAPVSARDHSIIQPEAEFMFQIDVDRREVRKHELASALALISIENIDLPSTLGNWNRFVREVPGVIHDVLSRDLGQRLFVASAIGGDGGLRLDMFISDDSGVNIGQMQRFVRFQEREVDHASASIRREYAMRGLGSLMIRNCLALYLRWRMRTVRLVAGRTVGGYVWARMGWQPTLESWGNLKIQFRSRLTTHVLLLTKTERTVIEKAIQSDDPRMVWRLADLGRVILKDGCEEMSIGKVLLLGTAWVGVLDLEGGEGLERLTDYLACKGLTA